MGKSISFYLLFFLSIGISNNANSQIIHKTLAVGEHIVELRAWDTSLGLPSTYIPVMKLSNTGHLFLYFPRSGMHVFDGKHFRPVPAPEADSTNNLTLDLSQPTFFHEDPKNNVWISSGKHPKKITVCTPTGRKCQTLSSYLSIHNDSLKFSNHIVNQKNKTTNYKKGKYRIQKDTLLSFDSTFQNHSLQIKKISLLFEEDTVIDNLQNFLFTQFALKGINMGNITSKENVFWMTSQTHLIRLTLRKKHFEVVNLPFNEPSVRSIHPIDSTTLLISTYNGDSFLATDNLSIKHFQKPFFNGSVIRDIQKINNKYWFGTEMGIIPGFIGENYKCNLKEIYRQNSGNALMHIPEKNELLIGMSYHGLISLNLDNNQEKTIIKGESIYTIFESKQQDIWIGFSSGLCNYKSKATYFKEFCIYHIYEEKPSKFWLATNKGLIEWEVGSMNYKVYDTSDGFSNNRIHSVYPDRKDNLWMSTDYGLIKFNKSKHYIKTFFKKDGLPNDEFNRYAHFQNEFGELFFGGINGLIKFDPNNILWENPQSLSPIIPRFIEVYDNKNVLCFQQNIGDFKMDKKIQIPSNSHRIELHFEFSNFDEPSELKKEWKTSSIYPSWESITENKITLHFLEYGQEDIEIRAYKTTDLVNQSLLQLQITKPIPFYKTTLFIFISIIGLIGLTIIITKSIYNYEQRKLRQLVKIKTQSIESQKEQILIQKEELQKVNTYKSKFFKNVSHDFKTPLSIILGITEGLEKNNKIQSTVLRQISKIKENTLQINNLTEQIFELSRIDNKTLSLQESTIEWSRFCKHIVDSFAPLAESKQIELRINQLPSYPLFLRLDQNKTEQIIRNLIDNALKFTPPLGKVYFSSFEDKNTIYFKVIDSGFGIRENEKNQVFDRYYQGQNTDELYITGLGLGLSICKEYVDLMKGSISVTTSSFGGASFQVTLPKNLSDEIPEKNIETIGDKTPQSSTYKSEPSIILNPNKPCLLIVEDNIDLLNFYKEELAPNYSLLLATNGTQALDILNKSYLSVDLIISDVMMPKTNGFQLLEIIKQDPKHMSIPFIFITALAANEQKLNALKIGVDTYLIKPFSMEELSIRIKNLLYYKKLRNLVNNDINTTEKSDQKAKSTFTSNQNNTTQNELLTQFEKAVNEKIGDPNLRIHTVAEALQISERTLRYKIKELTGLKPSEYITKVRLSKAMELLQNRRYNTVAEICYHVGFKNASSFSRLFKKEYGRVPSSYLNR
jgi:signal transduction histidine kinase/DNA-binding response OmpR family regulator